MLEKKEKNILRVITIVPIFMIILIFVVGTFLFISNKVNEHQEHVEKYKKNYITKNKKGLIENIEFIHQYIEYDNNKMENLVKEKIKYQTDEAYKIIKYMYDKYHKTHSKKEVLEKIKDALYPYSLDKGDSCFYVFETNGKVLMSPLHRDIENKNILKTNKKEYAELKQRMIEILNKIKSKKELFFKAKWTKLDGTKEKYEKINYTRIFKPYNIVVGIGDYVYTHKKQLQERILEYIEKYREVKDPNIFILRYDGMVKAHKVKAIVNTNQLKNSANKKNNTPLKQIIKQAKEGGGFLSYTLSYKDRPNIRKISYIKGFDDWQWAIGSSLYLNDLDKEMQKINSYTQEEKNDDILMLIAISLLVTTIMVIISFYSSSLLRKTFLSYKQELLKYISQNRKKDSLLAQKSKMAALGEMIQNISHQWRQPLSTISTVATGLKLKKDYDTLSDEEFLEGTKKIIESTQYLSQTIDDFRNYFTLEQDIKPFDFNNIVNKILQLLEVKLSENHIEVIQDIQARDVSSSENMLLQVLLNLFNNSKDEFVKKEERDNFIFISSKKTEEEFIISVKDNAGGIAKENLNKVFEAYFSTKSKDEGSGIGLCISNEVITNLGGEISVKNEEFTYNGKNYKGALFEIRLPLKK